MRAAHRVGVDDEPGWREMAKRPSRRPKDEEPRDPKTEDLEHGREKEWRTGCWRPSSSW